MSDNDIRILKNIVKLCREIYHDREKDLEEALKLDKELGVHSWAVDQAQRAVYQALDELTEARADLREAMA